MDIPNQIPPSLRDAKVIAHSDSSIHQVFPVAIGPDEGEALRSWTVREKAASTIEVGFAYGTSTLFICEGLLAIGNPDGRHIVLDPYQSRGFKNCGLQLLAEAGIANMVERYPEESQIALPAVSE